MQRNQSESFALFGERNNFDLRQGKKDLFVSKLCFICLKQRKTPKEDKTGKAARENKSVSQWLARADSKSKQSAEKLGLLFPVPTKKEGMNTRPWRIAVIISLTVPRDKRKINSKQVKRETQWRGSPWRTKCQGDL